MVGCDHGQKTLRGFDAKLERLAEFLNQDPVAMGPCVSVMLPRHNHRADVLRFRGRIELLMTVPATSTMAAGITASCCARNALDSAGMEGVDITRIEVQSAPARGHTRNAKLAV